MSHVNRKLSARLFFSRESRLGYKFSFGAMILRVGTPLVERTDEGGGLSIGFIPRDSVAERRCVFAFNEAGTWVEFEGSVQSNRSMPD